MNNKALLIFILFTSCFFSTIESAASVDSSNIYSLSNLFRDSVLNYYYYSAKDNKLIKMDYLGINYSKQLDSNLFEFKQIMNYKTSKIFSTIGFVGFSTTMLFALFIPGGSSSGGYDGRAGLGIDPIFYIAGTSFGVFTIIFNNKCNKNQKP